MPFLRSYFRVFTTMGAILAASSVYAKEPALPPAIKALESQGVSVVQEFKTGSNLRAFAGVAGDRPFAVYITPDGQTIVGTRLNSKAEPMDDTKLHELVQKPLGEKIWKQLQASTWVQDGKPDAPRVIYTFMDPNCPYCNRFWEAARPWVESGKVQLRHILVGIIKDDSPAKAAAILESSDRSAALLENERNSKNGGISPLTKISDGTRKILDMNKSLMLSMGFQGTPGISVRDEKGNITTYGGMPQPSALSAVLGPR